MNAEATVLKLYPLGENGLIAVWCTEEGLIRTAAKSARKPCSPFAGRLDIFYQCRMQWTQAKKGDLHTLTSADLLSPRLALRKSYLRLSAAGGRKSILVAPGCASRSRSRESGRT